MSERNIFKWELNGETLLAASQADDALLSPPGPGIPAEFLRRVSACFEITGVEGMMSKFCGY